MNQSLEDVCDVEEERSAEVARLTRSHNLPATSTLGQLMEIAPPTSPDRIRVRASQLSVLAADVENAGNRASDAAGASLADIEEFGALRVELADKQSVV